MPPREPKKIRSNVQATAGIAKPWDFRFSDDVECGDFLR
jgi:hypothetical protein